MTAEEVMAALVAIRDRLQGQIDRCDRLIASARAKLAGGSR